MDLKAVMTGETQAQGMHQNLINPVDLPAGGRAAFWKLLALDICGVLAALLVSFIYHDYLAKGISPWFVVGALLVFSVTSVVQVLLSKDVNRRFVSVVLEALALVAFFIREDSWEILSVTAIVMLLVLFWGYLSGRSYFHNSVEIPFFGGTGKVLGKVTTAAVLMMILLYIPQVNQGKVFTPPQTFETFFSWSSGLMDSFFPNISFNGTFGAFSADIAKTELEDNATFQSMSSSSQSLAIDQASSQVAGLFTTASGTIPAASEKTSDVIYGYIVKTLSNWQNQFQNGFIVGWVIVLFLILRTVGIVFVWVAQFVTLVFYELLLATGFMHVAEVSQTKEVIEF